MGEPTIDRELRIWVAARDTPTSWYVVRELARRRPLAGVVWERRRTRRETLRYLWRRTRRLGPFKVGDELLWRAIDPLLHGRLNRRVARTILGPPAERRRPSLPGIPQWTVQRVNGRATRERLRAAGVDILLLCGTSIVKAPLLEIPSLATLNIHAGITPAYRGVHAPFWALLNGERELVGITLHRVDRGIDSGAILAQERLGEIHRRETPLSLWYRLLPVAVELADRAIAQVGRGDAAGIDPADTELPSRLYTHPGLSDFLRLVWRRRGAHESRARAA